MELTTKLKEIAKSLNLNDVLAEIQFIEDRLNNINQQIIIPIVGEFSSGKTTLLNSLMDNKKLETASKPTTSVIYETFFGNEKEYAVMIFDNGDTQVVEDISELKNETFQNVSLVKIYDTSMKVPDSTVLVDTPGLSSSDSKHLEALSNYLPNADALIICIDANQQITNSLLNFLKINNLTHLPFYIIITKADTKTEKEIDQIKNYIAKNIDLPYDNLICVSSLKNELGEFFPLMDKIQKSKNQIINNSLNFKLESTKQYLKKQIITLLENCASDKKIETELIKQGKDLNQLKNAIEKLVRDTRSEIEEVEYDTIYDFKRIVSDNLDQIVNKKSLTIDQEAVVGINCTSSLVISNYQNEIRRKLILLANNRKKSEFIIPLRSLEGIDVSTLNIGTLNYNLDLASAGQENIKNISTALKLGAAIAAIVVAAPAIAGTVGTGAAGIGTATVVNAADTVTDVASIASNVSTKRSIRNQLSKLPVYASQIQANLQEVDGYNKQAGQMINTSQNDGFVENIVGKLGDQFLGKPQRKKMIDNYLDNSLIPEFKTRLKLVTENLLSDIQSKLNEEAEISVKQLEERLVELKKLFTEDNELFKTKIESYKKFIEVLSN